ncbi:MAG: hypothetical protein GX838_07050 [Clostridiaceae bacterium]|nr:hypothetical protein [Clostridiaceae bacterium]
MHKIIDHLSLAKVILQTKREQLKRSVKQYGWTIRTIKVYFSLWRQKRFVEKWLKYFFEAEQLAYFWKDTVDSFINDQGE